MDKGGRATLIVTLTLFSSPLLLLFRPECDIVNGFGLLYNPWPRLVMF